MKKIFSILLTVLMFASYAQVDRSVQPKPGPTSPSDFGKYKIYELDNGLKVIVVQNKKLPRITMNLVIDRDPIFEGEKAGYVSLAGEMLRQGTTTKPKADLDEEIDFMGANLGTSSSNVFTSGLSKNTESLMSILADVALNPAFSEEEFSKLKTQTISGLESNKDSPDAVAGMLYNKILYGKKHPYGESATVETANSINIEDCKAYYNKYWMPNTAYLTIVGDIKPSKAKKLAKKYFGAWERGTKPTHVYASPSVPSKMQVAFSHKESAVQSVIILGNTIDLKPGHPDNVKLNLTNQILGVGSLGRLFQNIREDKAYTYGAYSSYNNSRLKGEFNAQASVRNEVTDSAIVEFLMEFERMRSEPVSDEELEGAKQFIKGSFGRSLESPQTIANFALNIERYGLPEDYYSNYLSSLDNLTKEDIMATAKKYIRPSNMILAIVGKADDVAAKVEKFGALKYYDDNGDITDKPSLPVPAGITADMVLENYLKAIGGTENLTKIKDIAIYMDVAMAGAPFAIKAGELKKGNTKYKSFMTAEGMGTLQEQVYDGKKGQSSNMQAGTAPVEGEELEGLKQNAIINIELQYAELGFKMKLTKMAVVNGEKAFVMELTDPKGEVSFDYFSEATGLKLKSEQVTEGPEGPSVVAQIFSDYREVEGVLYPFAQTLDLGQQKLKFTVTEINVNKGIKNSEFTVK